MNKEHVFKFGKKILYSFFFLYFLTTVTNAQVTLEKEVKITDLGLHFNGERKFNDRNTNIPDNGNPDSYDYIFGRNISAHGDAVKAYGKYVFMTWYRGGKLDRHMMLSRYNTETGTLATIEFLHRHTGYLNKWWLGESHNTIAVGISPLDGTIHLLFDMHGYRPTTAGGSLSDDYFRYAYSVKNAAILPDSEFTLDKFVQDNKGRYKHLKLTGNINQTEFHGLTYPSFFLNDQGDLLMKMREGGDRNGMYKFTKYEANTGNWTNFTDFNRLNAKSQPGITYNWGLYGDIKYAAGKIRVAYQRRSENRDDKFSHQNGIYYAYSDNQDGSDSWKNHKGEPISVPIYDSDLIKIAEPGDFVQTTKKDQVQITGGLDFTVTDRGDEHFISSVRDAENNVRKNLHTYRPAGETDFITTDDFAGGSTIYTSGNSIFIIGLNNGRVYVEKAEGGTNNFERVYQQTGGKQFDHGVVHIYNGKAYYYLMEDTSGSAMPLYLQIIDLDLPPTDPTLPNNFTVQTIGETCQDKNNGRLIIESAAVNDYVATVNGTDYSFTKNTTIEDLNPGTYTLCISVVGMDFTTCYEVVIPEAENLSAKISVSKKSAAVSVDSGTAPYTVYKNGEVVLETYLTSFNIAVDHGDQIAVKSKEACQGEMSKTINLLEDVRAYPNPSNGAFEFFIPNDIEEIGLELYDIQSRLIVSKIYKVTKGRVAIDIKDKPSGVYFAKINSKNPVFVKLIKN